MVSHTITEKHYSQLLELSKLKGINRDTCQSPEELIFLLWQERVPLDKLGFGYPYDDMLKGYALISNQDKITGLKRNPVHLTYLHSAKIPDFLEYALLLPRKEELSFFTTLKTSSRVKFNLIKFNDILKELGKEPISCYEDLQRILRRDTLTRLELCCLLWEAANWGLYDINLSPWNLIDEIK